MYGGTRARARYRVEVSRFIHTLINQAVRTSQFTYSLWKSIHAGMTSSMTSLGGRNAILR